MQVHDPNYIVSDVFERCQEPEAHNSPGFCLTKPTLVKKVKKSNQAVANPAEKSVEMAMNNTGN